MIANLLKVPKLFSGKKNIIYKITKVESDKELIFDTESFQTKKLNRNEWYQITPTDWH